MRTHRERPALIFWTQAQLLNDLVKASALCAARMEAVGPAASLDLTFLAGDRVAVVPCILIRAEELEQRENSPFVWPQAIADLLNTSTTERIEQLLLPWVESLTLGRQFIGEAIRVFGGAAENGVFEAARAARFLGAARYEDVLDDVAPYAYAGRFAGDKLVSIRDMRGSFGAVMLDRSAAGVRADLRRDDLNVLARRWYAADLFGETSDRCDVSIADSSAQHAGGACVRVSLDAARHFTVECDVERPLRSAGITAVEPVGGSSGRILLLLRDDWRSSGDADGDDATALAQRLQAEGFSVDLRGASETQDIRTYDLVHAFTAVAADQLLQPLRTAHDAGVPVVLTPALDDVCAQGAWGSRIVPTLLDIAHDELELGEHLRMLELRRLEAPGIHPRRQEPFPGYDHAVRETLNCADAVIVSGPAEEAFLRALGCTAPAVHGAPHVGLIKPDRSAAQTVGTGPFVLVHAPVEPRNNQYLILRAAAQAGLPVVVAGPIADAAYHQVLQQIAGERVIFVPVVTPNLADALYRSAQVYADLAWISYGLSRVAAAGAAGCALVLARGSRAAELWGADGWAADPASVDSIAVALGDAWMHAAQPHGKAASQAARIAAWADPRGALHATVQAYALAQQARVRA